MNQTETKQPLKLGFLASHSGSAMRAIVEAMVDGRLEASVAAVVISNNSRSPALSYAMEHGIPTLHISSVTHSDADRAICSALLEHGVDLVVLSGYMKKLGAAILKQYNNRIINIHPSLLPDFGGRGMYGNYVHEAVLAAGRPVSGATVHLVNGEYDQGNIILQDEVPVFPEDTVATLAERVRICEQEIIVKAVKGYEQNIVETYGHWNDEL